MRHYSKNVTQSKHVHKTTYNSSRDTISGMFNVSTKEQYTKDHTTRYSHDHMINYNKQNLLLQRLVHAQMLINACHIWYMLLI